MHAPFDRSNKSDTANPGRGNGFLIIPALIVIVLVTLTITRPNDVSRWINESVEAEFIGGGTADDAPTQVARPDMATPERTVLAN